VILIDESKGKLAFDITQERAISYSLGIQEDAIAPIHRLSESIVTLLTEKPIVQAFGSAKLDPLGKHRESYNIYEKFIDIKLEQIGLMLFGAESTIRLVGTSLFLFAKSEFVLPYPPSGELKSFPQILKSKAILDGINVDIIFMHEEHPALPKMLDEVSRLEAVKREISESTALWRQLTDEIEAEAMEFGPARRRGALRVTKVREGMIYSRLMLTEKEALISPFFYNIGFTGQGPTISVRSRHRLYEMIYKDTDHLIRINSREDSERPATPLTDRTGSRADGKGGNPMASFSVFARDPKADLLVLNPWAAAFAQDLNRLVLSFKAGEPTAAAEPFFLARRAASRGRLLGPSPAWNAWAMQMLALNSQIGGNESIAALWRLVGETDLRGERFPGVLNLGGREFPATLNMEAAVFEGDVWLNQSRFHAPLIFSSSESRGDLNCEGAIFEQNADFSNMRCRGRGEFRDASFVSPARFERADFGRDVWFRGSRFRGPITFQHARFAGEAGLGNCTYDKDANFSHVSFVDNAGFDGARFEGPVTFESASFGRHAWFSNAKFGRSAVFDRAKFLGPMHFEGIQVAEQRALTADELQQFVGRPMN
jgi:hypothetical protein